MKNWIIAGLILIGWMVYKETQAAEEFLMFQFNSDVRIVLSHIPCDTEQTYRAVAQRIDRQFIPGCWHMTDNGMVRIQWLQGDFSEFPLNLFEVATDVE